MTEDDARTWIYRHFGTAVMQALSHFVELVRDEAPQQNLVSASSLDHIWARHVVDSAQLVALDRQEGRWIDVGTGAGFPGMVAAAISGRETLLVEPRRRRVDFLRTAIAELGLANVSVHQARIETVSIPAATISARAVASVDDILRSAMQCATNDTIWILPKGRNANAEVAEARKNWHGMFHVEHSVTDAQSMIVVASGIAHR